MSARRRTLILTCTVTLLAVAASIWGLVIGSSRFGIHEVVQALLLQAPPGVERVVLHWRLPRVLFTLLAGGALAIAGAIFQSQTRNPLGSPDIIGFTTGAYSAVLIGSVLSISGVWQGPLLAVAGGGITGIVVYLLAGRGGAHGLKIILVGIGISLFLGAINAYLLRTLKLEEAMAAAVWGTGSVNNIAFTHVIPLVIALVVIVPITLSNARDMRLMEMGDDIAISLGINCPRVRLIQYAGAIILVAVVTASAGPIAFVSLVAPQLAKRLTGTSSVSLLPSAAVGALLLSGSDLLARAPFMPVDLPIGTITLCVGGIYFVYLLIRVGKA